MASLAPNTSATGATKHGRRPVPARRTGILATETSGWTSWSLPAKRQSLFRQEESNAQERVARPPRNKAVLIGIQYEHNEDFVNLLLAHRDIRKVRNMLLTVYNFDSKDIAVLLDDKKPGSIEPTKENILQEMANLMDDVQVGDQLYFHYSGHGEQIDCIEHDPTEDDNKDECIVPSDAKQDDPDSWIVDNTLNKMLVKTLPVGAHLMAIFDMCHSGTALDLKNHYYAEEGKFIRRCTRKFTSLSRQLTRALSRRTKNPRSRESPQRGRTISATSKDQVETCLVITSERLSTTRVKSRKLTVSLDTPPSPRKDARAQKRQFSMSKSEKVYKLEHHLMERVPGRGNIVFSTGKAPSLKRQRAESTHTRISGRTIHPLSTSPNFIAQENGTLSRPSTFPMVEKAEDSPVDKDCKPFSFVPSLLRSLTDEHFWRKKGKSKAKVEKEWNVFSASGLKTRKSTLRARIDTSFVSGRSEVPETRQLRPVTPSERSPENTILPSGYIFDSPPGSPSSSKSVHAGNPFENTRKESLMTGQAISIGAATDAQMAMEYACKGEDNKYKMKSLTATLVEILSKDPHPTLANLMVALSAWLKESSEEMHRHYENRRDNPPPRPKDSVDLAIHETEDMVQAEVLENRPIQEPVLGTQIKTDIDKETFLPLSQRHS